MTKQKKSCPLNCYNPKTVCVRGYMKNVEVSASSYNKRLAKYL